MKKINIIILFLCNISICLFAQNIKERDNFYLAVNQKWIDTTQTNQSTLDLIYQKTNQQLLQVLVKNAKSSNQKKKSPEKKLADYYNSGLDTLILEKRGLEPLKRYFDRIDNVKNFEEFFILVAKLHKEGHSHFLGIKIAQDSKKNGVYALHLEERPLTLGFASVYEAEGDIFDSIRKNYKQYLTTIFKLIGKSNKESNDISNEIFEFEKELAKSYMSNADLYDPVKAYNKIAVNSLEKQTPNLKWTKLLHKMEIKSDSVIVINPNYIYKLNTLTEKVSLETWKNKLKANIILSRTIALDFSFREAMIQLKSVFSGSKIYPLRSVELFDYCNNEILGKLYVEEYFSFEKKKKVEKIALDIKNAFRNRILNNQWMSKETKIKAVEKLDSMKFKIGFPDEINNYDDLKIKQNFFFENIDNWSAFIFNNNIVKLNKKYDEKKWSQVLPQDVNAYYDTDNNQIIFPAALLQEPLFIDNQNEASLYGSIGYIIGHELTHGFDKNGRKYNFKGQLENWWNENDEKAFGVLCSRLIDQFNEYEVSKDIFINGEQTLSENIADLGGISIAYDAYKMSSSGKKGKLELDKEFFYAFAKVWREKTNEQELKNCVLRDTHAPVQWRVNGILSNFTPFYRVFEIDEKDKMFKKVKDRIAIW